jgi:membrane fusion protein (multidrug efflux system)
MMQEGQQVAFSLAAYDSTLSATIYAIEPSVKEDSRTVMIRAKAPNPQVTLLPGSYAKVKLQLSQADDALMVPTSAIIPELQGHKIYVVEDGKAQERQIQLGTRTEKFAAVEKGLAPGDTVITAGYLLLQPGDPVKVDLSPANATQQTAAKR